MAFFNIFRKQTEGQPKLVFRARTPDVTAEEWRKNNKAVESAREILNDIRMQQMLTVLQNESPGNKAAVTGNDIYNRAIIQAMTEGYNSCIFILESLGKPWKSQFNLEATYEPEEMTDVEDDGQQQ